MRTGERVVTPLHAVIIHIIAVEPRYNEGPRDLKHVRYNESSRLFLLLNFGRAKTIVRYTKELCYIEVRFIEVPLYTFLIMANYSFIQFDHVNPFIQLPSRSERIHFRKISSCSTLHMMMKK